MKNEREQFLAAIAAAPWEDPEGVRQVYADWLEERGEDDEASRQREYVSSIKGLLPYTREWDDNGPRRVQWMKDNPEDYEGEPLPVFNIKNAMKEIQWWAQTVQGKGERHVGVGTPKIGFGTDFASDELEDVDKRREFWRCFVIVTGVTPPEELANQRRYHCAC